MLDCGEPEGKYKRITHDAVTDDAGYAKSDHFEKPKHIIDEATPEQRAVPPQKPAISSRLTDNQTGNIDPRNSLKEKVSEAMKKDKQQ
jgi:hypothetical protein